MNSENWQQIKQLFNQAVELEHGKQADFLAKINAAEVRREVEKLLAADSAASDSRFENSPIIYADETSRAGEIIGNYRIEREIGRGGMGVVYLAVREDLKKQVALKIIKRGMDSDDIVRRFRTEREILAALEHPNIARLLDGGTTAEGLPFFVLEFVEGLPLNEFVEQNNLPLNARLELFRKVCAAVQYAHSRLVVHRDLKPSNILVTPDGTPKLLDFGISKLLSAENADQTGTATQLGMMTPAYASPEQKRGETVSTATDIYSLGVILSELVQSPKSKVQSPKSKVQNRKTALAGKSTTDDNGLWTLDFGLWTNTDLQAILQTALREEQTLRYSTVEQFAEDIRRYLTGLPVTARADTVGYRASKFVGRNRAAVFSAALIVLALIGGIAGTSWQAVRAAQAQKLSEKRFVQVRALANNVLFKYYDEVEKLEGSTKVREMFVTDALNYLDSLSQDAAGDESLQAELGQAYLRVAKVQGRGFNANLGNTSGAIESYGKAIALLEPLAVKSNDTKLQWDLVSAYGEMSNAVTRQGDTAKADALLRTAFALNEKFLAAHPDDVTLLLRLSINYLYLGDTLPLGKGENENIQAFRRSAEAAEIILKKDPNHIRANNLFVGAINRVGTQLNLLSRNAAEMGDEETARRLRAEAAPLYTQSIEGVEEIMRLQPDEALNRRLLATAKFNRSEPLFEAGQYESALQIQLEGLRDFTKFTVADAENREQKSDLTYIHTSLGATYSRLGDFGKSEYHFKQALQIFAELIAHDEKNYELRNRKLFAAYTQADELLKRGEIERARAIYTAEFAEFESLAREKDAKFADSLRGYNLEKLGNCDFAQAKQNNSPEKRRELLESARANFAKALEIWQASGGAQISPGVSDAGRIEIVRRKSI